MMRRAPLVVMAVGVAALLASAHAKPSARLIYNASDSAPRGWYRVLRPTSMRVGDYVLTRLPYAVAALAAQRGYLPSSVPALKQIAAVAGQRVCIQNGIVAIDGRPLAQTLPTDGRARPMHAWAQCRPLVASELFLLSVTNPGSFDSRYFGPIDASFVVGRAVALWTAQ